jgi:hypothetical protein
MPTSTDPMTPLGVLHAFGYDLRLRFRQDEDGSKHFEIVALGLCLADAPLGEVGLTSGGLLYPALAPDAKHLGFGPTQTGGAVLMRFLVEIAAALDSGDALDGEWDFTPDPDSPLARRNKAAAVPV